jgi:predicted aspartyl protease
MHALLPRLLAALCAIVPLCAHADCRMAPVSHLPFIAEHGHLMVTVSFDQKPAQMIFDTGAFSTVITPGAAGRLQLAHMREELAGGPLASGGLLATMGGVGGGTSAMAVTARTLDVGGLKARNFNLFAADIGPAFADGLLSIDLISKYDVDLDFPESQIILYYPMGNCSAPAAFLEGPLYAAPLLPFGTDRRPRIKLLIGGQEVIALIDTGATHSVIFRRAAERLGLDIQSLAGTDRHVRVGGIGAKTLDAVTHVFPSVTIGDLVLENMHVDVVDGKSMGDDAEMLLGNNFQRAVHLWISYSSGTLIMQAPPRPSKKAPD